MCLHFSESALFTPFSSRQPAGRPSHTKVMCFLSFFLSFPSESQIKKSPVCTFLIWSLLYIQNNYHNPSREGFKRTVRTLILFLFAIFSGTAPTDDGLSNTDVMVMSELEFFFFFLRVNTLCSENVRLHLDVVCHAFIYFRLKQLI